MKIGKIDYINLIPFEVFVKSLPLTYASKKFLALKKSYPAKLNRDFLARKIQSGFISSIAARGQRMSPAGIIAKGDVWSVIVIDNEEGDDEQSATSNALAKVLQLQGRVLIGDRALQYYFTHSHEHIIDMGAVWYQRYRLPFVFGRFCYNAQSRLHCHIITSFVCKKVKIPFYILRQYALRSDLNMKDIIQYLAHISYKIGPKETRAIKKFYRECDRLRIKKIKWFA